MIDLQIPGLLSILSDRNRELFCMRYGLGRHSIYAVSDIAIRFGITKGRVRQLLKKCNEQLFEYGEEIVKDTLSQQKEDVAKEQYEKNPRSIPMNQCIPWKGDYVHTFIRYYPIVQEWGLSTLGELANMSHEQLRKKGLSSKGVKAVNVFLASFGIPRSEDDIVDKWQEAFN